MTFRLGDVAILPTRMRTEEDVRQRVCRRKVRHDSEEAARRTMEGLYEASRAEAGSLAVYLCHFCRGYHVGHP